MIRREGGKVVLRARKTGKVLGRHETMAGAVAQERAIKARMHANPGLVFTLDGSSASGKRY